MNDTVTARKPLSDSPDLQAFKLRGGSFTLLVVRAGDVTDPGFFSWLEGKVAQAPYFFQDAPMVLDLEGMAEEDTFDFPAVAGLLRKRGLVAIGVQNGTDAQNRAAAEVGLGVFPMWRAAAPISEVSDDMAEQADPEAAVERSHGRGRDEHPRGPSRVIEEPVRSGRQIYARNSDLVVLSTVSPGAELFADGHIHVYGPLRGRAFAGVGGNHAARIFCRSFDAELVAIAGHWRVREDMDDALIGKPVQIFLAEDQVIIAPDA
ncbi:MAG: septum site-determining protein MinC [Alphaproteobacteria bacterium]|nr:septum site-determining protein MinC [Alphaproteobacteria bacterium]